MKDIVRTMVCMALVAAAAVTANAKIELASPFSDGVVLQQQTKASIWGTADAGQAVSLTPSWNYKTVTVKADGKGRWSACLPTPKGSFTPYTITISSSEGDNLILRDVLVGEVWIGSGQSNMEMPIKGFNKCPLLNSAQVIAASAAYSGKIHQLKVPITWAKDRQQAFAKPAQWVNVNPTTAPDFSAVAYFFAQQLVDKLQVPVGLILSRWGGSNIEAWLSEDALKKFPDVDMSDKVIEKKDQHVPYGLYNGMIAPIVGYTVAGVIWYQGCSNVNKYRSIYGSLYSDMVRLWRKDWKKKLPVYAVEIAPYSYGDGDKTNGALLREQQIAGVKKAGNGGIVCTNDLVTKDELKQIHPANKQPIGARLAGLALRYNYDQKTLTPESPQYKKCKFKGSKAYITLNHTEQGFNRINGIQGFTMCGADSVFHPAEAVVKENRVLVYCKDVKEPVAVRYCFKNFQMGNLANKQGLPVFPFRTDKFAK